MSYTSARVFTKNIELSSNSLSSYNVTKIADYIGNTILLYKCSRTFRHRREPVRSPGRHPHGGMLARQQAFMLTSSTAPKSPHTPSAPSLRLPPAAQGIERPAAEQLHLPEKAHARCEQGSELMVCNNAIFGAVCRAVRCGAVRCSEVHSACCKLCSTGFANWCACRLFRARGCRASGQGSKRVAEAAVAAWRSPLGAHLARCRGWRRCRLTENGLNSLIEFWSEI